MHRSIAALLLVATTLCACASGNVRSARSYSAPAAPQVRNPIYNPYAPFGEANATWRPPAFNRDGTIVRPVEPSTDAGRPDYEHAAWATGAAGGRASAPPGTF